MSGISKLSIDPDTVRGLMRSDPAAQERVYRTFAKPVYNMVARVLQDLTLAEDVTQDIFVEVLTKAKSLRNPDSFASWLQRVAINQCYQQTRSPWFRRIDFRASASEMQSNEDPTSGVQVDRIFSKIAPKHRLVVWLYCIEGFSHEEIAKTLGRTASYSKSIISRANAQFNEAHSNEPVRQVTPSFQETWRATQ